MDVEAATTISHSQEFWFDDGSIILEVENRQFRVHRSILCANSVIFRDMGELSQPGEEETIEGCPKVMLQGDSVSDWIHMLQYLYTPARIPLIAGHLPFPMVASVLRLATKYDFADIRALALQIIHIQVPTNALAAWADQFDTRKNMRVTLLNEAPLSPDRIPGEWLTGNEFDLLNLCIEQDVQTILPVVYYLCIHNHPLERILNGIHRGDTLSMVRPEAMNILLLGRQQLQSAFYTMTMSWVAQKGLIPSSSCVRSIRTQDEESTSEDEDLTCEGWKTMMLKRLLSMDFDNLRPLDASETEWFMAFCSSCSKKIRSTSNDQRQLIWSNLPNYFNLPPWKELKDRE